MLDYVRVINFLLLFLNTISLLSLYYKTPPYINSSVYFSFTYFNARTFQARSQDFISGRGAKDSGGWAITTNLQYSKLK